MNTTTTPAQQGAEQSPAVVMPAGAEMHPTASSYEARREQELSILPDVGFVLPDGRRAIELSAGTYKALRSIVAWNVLYTALHSSTAEEGDEDKAFERRYENAMMGVRDAIDKALEASICSVFGCSGEYTTI